MGLSISTLDRGIKAFLYSNVSLGVFALKYYQNEWMLYSSLALTAGYTMYESAIKKWFQEKLITQNPVDTHSLPSRAQHDMKRTLTYPSIILNTWYHLCDSSEVQVGKVLEVRALGQTFAVWRDNDGKVHCQDAFCIHIGANLAVGGTVENNNLVCPFHRWKFNGDGSVAEIPYLKDPKSCPTHTKLKTYHCVEFCNWVCVYYHADRDPSEPPLFEMPQYIADEIREGEWAPHLKWDIGFTTLNIVDWVDQSGDHAHFHTLHNEFLIPWTVIPLPRWLLKLVPLGICHRLTTYIGDDKEWAEKVKESGFAKVDKHMVFFYDYAGLTWNGKPIESTMASTLETYVGPSMIIFHIPFTIGTFKVFVSTLPVEGGSIMRVRTWVDKRIRNSYWLQWITWILSGISASQLMCDINILNNKIRQRKPVLQPFDGPYNRTNAWMKNFYSESTPANNVCTPYANEW